MDIRRKVNRECHERILQYKIRQAAMLVEELVEDKLTQLLEFIDRLKQTPPGSAELRGRVKSFGECNRIKGEDTASFYGRLRYWLDRDIPQARTPRRSRSGSID
jgi:hypothetical protein